MTHTVHLDRQGYVVESFLNTKIETLDARKYPGTLMEVTGDVCAGWRWDGQRFVLPPPRVPPQSVVDERVRRSAQFPERFVRQMTALGGSNATKVSNYLSEVNRVAESMLLGDPPRDFKDDRHWPTPPVLDDAPVPVRVQDSVPVSAAPVTVNIAPVINTTQAEPKALVVHHEPARDAPSAASRFDDYGLDRNDPLYDRKAKLIAFIENEVEPDAPDDESWKDALGRLAAMHTESQSLDELEKREDAVFSHIEGRAA
jgi:hypothetical protein